LLSAFYCRTRDLAISVRKERLALSLGESNRIYIFLLRSNVSTFAGGAHATLALVHVVPAIVAALGPAHHAIRFVKPAVPSAANAADSRLVRLPDAMAGCVAAWSAAGGAFGMGEFGNRCAHLCSPGLYNGVRAL